MEYLIYSAPLAIYVIWYYVSRSRLKRQSFVAQKEALEAGLTEPASLHPAIDYTKCIGCGSCVNACPEQSHHAVLGIIDGKADLVGPTNCIGHGACAPSCPVDAITLVFGTARRGVDLPRVSPWFETNVPGVFVAGELGGMGLIRNAVEQGRQAMGEIIARRPRGDADELDVLIVGAGPAGFSASLAALEAKLKFKTIEQESLGGCVFQYPRGKIVMTQPAVLPIVGKVKVSLTSKEELLQVWLAARDATGLEINENERVEAVTPVGDGFLVKTSKGEYRARTVLLSVGRRGTPRKLGVKGEDQSKVVYRLIDPEQYSGQRVIVVGGGDSALEAAASLAEAGATAVLSYRGDAFGRAKQRNRERIKAAESQGSLTVMLKSEIEEICADKVRMKYQGGIVDIPNDAVIVNAGGVLPTDFLKGIGITVETKWGTA
jgi:thioredoxin reductase/NAD-dependent dihydropyrimidine dehydrogenase PreA subunit